jgi:hypothetical protein
MEGVFYHGSDSKIQKFSDEFAGKIGAINAEGPGIYFTNSKKNAAMWGKLTYTVYLRPRKVISNTKTASQANRKDMKKFLDMINNEDYVNNRSPNIKTDKIMAINAAIDYSDTEYEAWHSLRAEQYNGAPQQFMRAMSKLGYDATLLYKKDFEFNDVDKVYHCIVYNPEIVEITNVERNNNVEEIVRKSVKKIINEIVNKKK